MNQDYVELAGHDVIGKLQEHDGKLARGKEHRNTTLSARVAVGARNNVGDARKVFEKFFRNQPRARRS